MHIASNYRLRGFVLITFILILLFGLSSLRTIEAASNTNFESFATGTAAEDLIITGISGMTSSPSNSTTVEDLSGVASPPFSGKGLLNATNGGTLTINFSGTEGSYTFNFATNIGTTSNTFTVEGFRSNALVFTDTYNNTSTGIFEGTATHSGTSFDKLVISASTQNWAMDNFSTTDVAAGVTLIETDGSTDVVESGGTNPGPPVVDTSKDTYDFELNTAPTAKVDVAVATVGQCSVSPTNFTINSGTVGPQTITVTAVDDAIVDATPYNCTITHTLTSTDGAYNSLTKQLTAHITDDDGAAGITVVETGGETDYTEGQTPPFDRYTVALTAKPSASVTITGQPDANCDSGAGPGVAVTGTFTAADWNIPQEAEGEGVDDHIAQGPHTCLITHTLTSSDNKFNNVTGPTVTVHITDNDTAGVTVTESGGNTAVTEGGATDTYTIVLTSQPVNPVTITVSPDINCTVDKPSINFAADTTSWQTAQTITVTAVNDNVAQGTHQCVITHTDSSTDPNYNATQINSVTASVADNDAVGVKLTQSGPGTSVVENGATDNYTVVLTSQPVSGTVTVTATPQASCNVGAGAGTAIQKTFTTSNWNSPQTITVSAVNDNIAQGTHTCDITHTVSASSDTAYNTAPITGGTVGSTITTTITDDDVAGVTIDQGGDGTTVNENGTTDTYTIAITSQPNGTVTVTATPDSSCNLGAGPGVSIQKTFNSGNWTVAQTITVAAVNDSIAQGVHTCTITHSVSATASDTNYNPAPISGTPVIANILDDDTPGATLAITGGSTTVTEGGPTDTYTAVLNTQPVAGGTGILLNVTVSAADNHCTVDKPTLTFTSANWNTPQTITVTAINDTISNTLPYTCTINHSLAGDSKNANYTGATVTGTPIVATVIDNDTAGITLTESNGSTDIQEGGSSDSYNIVLNTQPSNNVLITVDPEPYCNVGAGAGNPVVKTFTSSNWNTAQTITVTAVAGSVVSGHPNCTITNTPSGDATYSALSIPNVIAHISVINPAGAAPTRNYFVTHTPSLTWNKVPGATRYELQVSTTATFTPATTTTYQVGNSLFFTLPSTNDGVYYWRVRACTSNTVCGAYSPNDSFTIAA